MTARAPWTIAIAALALLATACTGVKATPDPADVVAEATPTTTHPPTTSTVATPTTTTPPPDPQPAGALARETLAWDLSVDATQRRLEDDLDWLIAEGPRPAGSPAEARVATGIIERLLATTRAATLSEVPLPDRGTTRNIAVTFGRGDRHLLIGAHYDSVPVSPGIDDNGSGTVILLELARRLSTTAPAAKVSLVFFGGEEILTGFSRDDHHFGSRKMASRLAAAGRLPDLMISADMIGVGSRLHAATYRDTDTGAADLLREVGERLGIDVTVISRGDISDHEAFARAGVPAAFLWRPDNPAWHTAGDDRVEMDLVLEDLALLEGVIAEFARATP